MLSNYSFSYCFDVKLNYKETSETSKMKLFGKIVDSRMLLNYFVKTTIFDV